MEDTMAYPLRDRVAPSLNKVVDWLLCGGQFQEERIPGVKVHKTDSRVELTITATNDIFPLLQPG